MRLLLLWNVVGRFLWADSPGLTSWITEPRPWEEITANSEQRNPLYVGATPRQMVFEKNKMDRPGLPARMKAVGEAQARVLFQTLQVPIAQFEIWPTLSDKGDPTWVFARWRASRLSTWQWFSLQQWKTHAPGQLNEPFLPQPYNPALKPDFDALFLSTLERKSLYDKPLFGDAVWMKENARIVGAWYPPAQMESIQAKLRGGAKWTAYILPQPARFNDKPFSVLLRVGRQSVHWPPRITWEAAPPDPPPVRGLASALPPLAFPSDYSKQLLEGVQKLAGEKEAVFPLSQKRLHFSRKNSAEQDHQLNELVEYLSEHYRTMGLQTIRYPVDYYIRQNGQSIPVPQANLFAVIPGRLSGVMNRPILLADHIDTAFAEDVFRRKGKRVSVPGANDNGAATQTLLLAARVLQKTNPEHDIWLAHFTGEEFPADDLGIRAFLSDHLRGPTHWSPALRQLMGDKRDLGGVVLLDMIGYRREGENAFQINLGRSPESYPPGLFASEAAGRFAPEFRSVVRTRFDPKSYLYNTDGYILDHFGYPIVLFNENLNRFNRYGGNTCYHQTTDTTRHLDLPYAEGIGKTAIATVHYWAMGLGR